MSMKIKLVLVAFLMAVAGTTASAQRIAISTNLLEDAILTPNIGVEVMMADKHSLTFDTSIAPFKTSQYFYNKCMTLRAGYKYWFEQALYSHYIGFDAVATSSDQRLGNFNTRDQYIGVGIGYGYSFIVGKRFNVIPCIGLGVAYGKNYEGYDRMDENGNGVEAIATPAIRPILTRLGVTIQYVLR